MKWGTVELVLAIEPTAASEWMAGPMAARGRSGAADHRGQAANAGARVARQRAAHGRASKAAPTAACADTATAIADALSRMPGISPVGSVEGSTVRTFVEPGGAWWGMVVTTAGGARRVTASCQQELTPGVWRCETVNDASVEAGAPLALDDALPQALKDVLLNEPDALSPAFALPTPVGAWRRIGPDGAVVDIRLHVYNTGVASDRAGELPDAPEVSTRTTKTGSARTAASPKPGCSPLAFCELRLAAYVGPLDASTDAESPSSSSLPEGGHARRRRSSASEADEKTAGEGSALRALFAAAASLTDVLPVFPTLMDGCARVGACAASAATAAPVRAAHIDLSDAKTPHGALVDLAASITRQWFGNEAGVRAGVDTEFVHQMRVALRRLKTLLKTFPRWADDAWKRTIVPDLDWLGELLGRARDLDVFVDATLPALAAADIDGAAWVSLQARAGASRDEARATVRAALRTRRYAALLLAWLQWLSAQRGSAGPAAMMHKTLAGYAHKRVRRHYRRLISKPALTALTPAERHRRRIEAKRLRYTLEFFEPLASHKTRRTIAKQLGRIQSVLGDGSDATAALHFLEALDVPPYEHGFARGWCEAVNRWSAVEGDRLLRELDKPKIVRAG